MNQKNSCIAIPSKFEKSGTTVTIADVNLVNASIKQYVANIIYKSISTFGIYPNIIQTIIVIIIKNIDTKLDATIDIAGISIKEAWLRLGEILGEENPDDMIDELFSRFCLGK